MSGAELARIGYDLAIMVPTMLIACGLVGAFMAWLFRDYRTR